MSEPFWTKFRKPDDYKLQELVKVADSTFRTLMFKVESATQLSRGMEDEVTQSRP
jgi:hypothetical protein